MEVSGELHDPAVLAPPVHISYEAGFSRNFEKAERRWGGCAVNGTADSAHCDNGQ